jgi:hypothetical protein
MYSKGTSVRKGSTPIAVVLRAAIPSYFQNELTPWSRALLEKLSVAQLLMNIPTFHGTWMYVSMFARVRHRFLLEARLIRPTPSHHGSLWSILYHPPIYFYVFLVVSFFLAFPSKSFMHSFFPPCVLHALRTFAWSPNCYFDHSSTLYILACTHIN